MGFEIGKIYTHREVASSYGYSENKQSMRGGLFYRNGTVILVKDESGKDYDDKWDPYRPGVLRFYMTTKHLSKNRSSELIDLPLIEANQKFKDGDAPIVVFSKKKEEYRYMGEFERIESIAKTIQKNGYNVPGLEIKSKNPELIKDYIGTYYENSEKTSWTHDDLETFSRLYEPSCITEEDIHFLAISLKKTSEEIREVIKGLNGGVQNVLSQCDLEIIKQKENEKIEFGTYYVEGFDKNQMVKVRYNQNIFRKNLDIVFHEKCCLTNIKERSLLRASHVFPWSESTPIQKVDPNNGLLLNSFHDSLFDKHLMTVYRDGDVEYSDTLCEKLGSLYDVMCRPFSHIDWPDSYSPLREAFDDHNRRFRKMNEMGGTGDE